MLVFLFIDFQPVGISFSIVAGVITFMTTTGLVVFNKKLQKKTEPAQTLKILDNTIKVIIFVLFLYEIYNSFYDKNSLFSLFYDPIRESLLGMKDSFLLTVGSILTIVGVIYVQIRLSKYITRKFIEKD